MGNKLELMALLEKEYQTTLKIIENCDLETVAHPDSGWRIKDIIIHVSFHDFLRLNKLNAYLKSIPYDMPAEWQLANPPEDLHKRNQLIYVQRQHYSNARVLADYKIHRTAMNAFYQQLTDDQLSMEYPTNYGVVTVEKTVEWTIGHDTHHRTEILAALGITQPE